MACENKIHQSTKIITLFMLFTLEFYYFQGTVRQCHPHPLSISFELKKIYQMGKYVLGSVLRIGALEYIKTGWQRLL